MLINPIIDPKWRGEIAEHHDEKTKKLIEESGFLSFYFKITDGVYNGDVGNYLNFHQGFRAYDWHINRTIGQWIHCDTYFEWDSEKYNITSHYGVADGIVQALEYHRALLDNPNTICIVCSRPMYRGDQGQKNNWRWHKWGKYIGDFEPQMEYLYDEPEITHITCFNIIRVGFQDLDGCDNPHQRFTVDDVIDECAKYDLDLETYAGELLDEREEAEKAEG